MEKFAYRLTTLSSLVVSPRANEAFYEALENFSPNEIKNDPKYLKKDKLKIIYPFYRYGEYAAYMPKRAEYYLPGTSVKGALCQGSSVPDGFMVDDVPIPGNKIVLRNLYKAQYLEDTQQACFDVFFENVGVEMIKAKTELTGEFYIKDKDAAETLLRAADQATKAKMDQMLKYLRELKKKGYKEELLRVLHEVEEKLSPLVEVNDMFLFGGYKGLLHSIDIKSASQEIEGAIFVDRETMLPHGLVRIEFI